MLGLGLNITKGVTSFLPEWLKVFVSRVSLDGGDTEKTNCAKSDIKSLQKLERPVIIVDALSTDVSTEGGTLEAKSCMVSSINSLFVPQGVFAIILPFEEDVLADGGSVESASCLINSMEELHTIL